jgi:hypothetical protein
MPESVHIANLQLEIRFVLDFVCKKLNGYLLAISINEGAGLMQLPLFGLVKQVYPQTPECSVGDLLQKELERTNLLDPVLPGNSVLLTAGSRGIDSKPAVLAALVKAVKARRARPFIMPAMGSHGGGTAEDQVQVPAHLGITEETVGAPIYEGWDDGIRNFELTINYKPFTIHHS